MKRSIKKVAGFEGGYRIISRIYLPLHVSTDISLPDTKVPQLPAVCRLHGIYMALRSYPGFSGRVWINREGIFLARTTLTKHRSAQHQTQAVTTASLQTGVSTEILVSHSCKVPLGLFFFSKQKFVCCIVGKNTWGYSTTLGSTGACPVTQTQTTIGGVMFMLCSCYVGFGHWFSVAQSLEQVTPCSFAVLKPLQLENHFRGHYLEIV